MRKELFTADESHKIVAQFEELDVIGIKTGGNVNVVKNTTNEIQGVISMEKWDAINSTKPDEDYDKLVDDMKEEFENFLDAFGDKSKDIGSLVGDLLKDVKNIGIPNIDEVLKEVIQEVRTEKLEKAIGSIPGIDKVNGKTLNDIKNASISFAQQVSKLDNQENINKYMIQFEEDMSQLQQFMDEGKITADQMIANSKILVDDMIKQIPEIESIMSGLLGSIGVDDLFKETSNKPEDDFTITETTPKPEAYSIGSKSDIELEIKKLNFSRKTMEQSFPGHIIIDDIDNKIMFLRGKLSNME